MDKKRGILEVYRRIPEAHGGSVFRHGLPIAFVPSTSASSGSPPAEAAQLKTVMTHVHAVHTDLIDSMDRPLNDNETVTIDSLHQESKRETNNNEIPGIEMVEPLLTDPLQVAQIQSVIDGCKLCSFGIQNELGSMAITDIDGLALMHSRTGACMFKGLPTVPLASDEPNIKITCPACLKTNILTWAN